MTSVSATIEILFIRHGESEENEKMQNIHEGMHRFFKEWKCMTRKQLSNCMKMFSFDIDSKLSTLGLQQIQEMKSYLDSKQFWQEKFPFHRVLYSPYERTRRTCMGIIPSHYLHARDGDDNEIVIPLEELKEISPYENHFQSFKLDEQIYQFRKWFFHQYIHNNTNNNDNITDNTTTPIKRIVIIGHARYFQRLLTLFSASPFFTQQAGKDKGGFVIPLMRNCDIWKVNYHFQDIHNIESGKFSQPKLIYRSPLAYDSPVNDQSIFTSIFSKRGGGGGSVEKRNEENYLLLDELISDDDHPLRIRSQRGLKTGDGNVNSSNEANGSTDQAAANNADEEEEEEPTCRICQAKKSESPELKMLRPCLCAGSLAYVHLDCLNQWRSTSDAAYSSCSICHFHYRVQKNFISAVLLEPSMIIVAMVVFFAIAVVISGIVFQYILSATNSYPQFAITKTDVITYLYDITLPTKHFCKLSERYNIVDNVYGVGGEPLGPSKLSMYFYKQWIKLSIWITCTPFSWAVLENFLLGAPLVAAAGHLIHNVRMIRQAMGGNQNGWAGMMNVTFLFLGNDIPFMLRLYTIMGCLLFLKDMREDYSVALRQWSHRIGNEVMNADD